MALRNLTPWNDELFRKKSRSVEKFDDRLWTLLNDMRETLENVGGYGCAAVHVGVLRCVVVVNDDSGVIELINPAITESSEETQEVMEGSIAPGAPHGTVIRPKKDLFALIIPYAKDSSVAPLSQIMTNLVFLHGH